MWAKGLQLKTAVKKIINVYSFYGPTIENILWVLGLCEGEVCFGSSRWRLRTYKLLFEKHPNTSGQGGKTWKQFERTDVAKKEEKKKKRWRQWLDHNHNFTLHLYVCVRVYLCVCLCEFKFFFKRQLSFEIPLDMYLPERLLLMGEKKDEKLKKSLVTIWERTANKYCWLGPILFSAGVSLCLYIYVFSIIPFFLLGGGVSRQGVGLAHEREEGKE